MNEPPSEEEAAATPPTSEEFLHELAQRHHEWRVAVAAMPEVLTATEAAVLIRNITPKTVRTLASRGEMPGASRLGKEWRFSKSALLRHLQIPDPAETERGAGDAPD